MRVKEQCGYKFEVNMHACGYPQACTLIWVPVF
jgi:hypothetical protein